MPPASPDRDVPRAIVLLQSPREAAEQARVYRRRTRQKPRDRWLRVIALVSSLCVHLGVLVSVVLGPVYVPEPPPDQPGDALQVRFIPKQKDQPPPPPMPPPGALPKKLGPLHRGTGAGRASRVVDARSPALPAVPAPTPLPVPSIEPPVIDAVRRTVVPKPDKVTAARVPPVSVPRPAPSPDLQPVPLAGEPPTVTLETPPMVRPVPPKFQPEPPRKPQLEGNRPMPPPPSLAMPALPPQSPPKLAPPTLALDARVPDAPMPPSPVVARPQVAAAPPVPDLSPVPLPARATPTVNLAPQLARPTPLVAEQRPAVQAPAITVAPAVEPELAAVPVAPRAPTLSERPTPPAITAPRMQAPAPRVAVTVARPALSPSPADTSPGSDRAPESATPAAAPPALDAPDLAATPADAGTTGRRDVSSAPDATPQGGDTAAPGMPQGAGQAALRIGADGSIVLPAPGTGAGKTPGAVAQGSSAQGADHGVEGNPALAPYIQLRPHGDTQIMRHRAPDIGYRPTRFAQDWAPEGESSIDTALRHAVEKTTVKHTFHLPRG
ncbi:MAG: hypothetical protein KGN77_09755, partial [Xanthomonadaceae bacterium]|nr:hypothetical protein [Xanthomonadaceae bacterium]